MSRIEYGVNFDGRHIVHPGAYDRADTSAMIMTSPGSLNLPVILGTADAGEPGTLKWFSDPELARNYVRGGDIYTALDLVYSPSSKGGGGASTLGVMVVNPNEQASGTFGGITFTSKEFSDNANKIQVCMENGTTPGTKRLSLSKWSDKISETFDNVGALFKLIYTGEKEKAIVSSVVDSSTKKVTGIKVSVGNTLEDLKDDLIIDFLSGRFTTVKSIIKYVNSVLGYRAEVADTSILDMSPTRIEPIGKDISAKGAGAYIYDTLSSIAYIIEEYSSLVTIQLSVETPEALINFPASYLTGGKTGVSPISWAPFFDKLKKYFMDILIVLSDDLGIQLEALAHVQQMYLRKQKQMLFTGGKLGESSEDIKKRAALLNNTRAVIGYPDILYKPLVDGKPNLLPSYFTGALIAGRVAGVPSSEPVTFDYVNVAGIQEDLVAGDPVIDDLITSGVCTLERVHNGGIRIVQGITTHVSDNNIADREISVRRGIDELSMKVTKALEDNFVGKKGVKPSVVAVQNVTIGVLSQAVKDEDIIDFSEINVRFTGTAVYVDYKVSAVEPFNFILVTSYFVPSDLTAQNNL